MRAGTQTLIQALQALPWMNSDNDEDGPPDPYSADESDDDERPRGKDLLFSSLLFLKFLSSTSLILHPHDPPPLGPISSG